MSKKKKYINYAALNAEEENDRLKEVARTHRINKVLAGKRCPDRDGVIKLLNQRRKNMTKSELVNDMKRFAGAGFITKQKLADYMGIKKQDYINRYVQGLDRIDNKYYFIPDVAENICKRRTFQ